LLPSLRERYAPTFVVVNGENIASGIGMTVAGLASTKRYGGGSALVKSGAPGESVFVILDGRAVVRAGARRVNLGIGDFFGEMSLLDGEPRSATVTAQTDVLVMMIPRRKFLKLLEKEPRIAIAVMTTLSRRVRALQAAAGG
jgi:CRP-like cAMP-binding protein